jgi:hypothetical protein
VKWLEPFTNDVILQFGKQGIDDVLVVPISFVSEHIETLYELDILYQKVAADAGVRNLRRVLALNSDPAFIRALAEIVRRGGRDIQEKVAKPPLLERTGWSLWRHVLATHSATFCEFDHPVCAASEASRLFLTGAATPPHEEGTPPTSCFGHSTSHA